MLYRQFAFLALFAAVLVTAANTNDSYIDLALKYMAKYPLIDGHNDFPGALRHRYRNKIQNISLYHQPALHTDINRLRSGRLAAQFWSIYMPCQNQFSAFSDNVRDTLEQIDLVHRFTAQYNREFSWAFSAGDVVKNFRQGRISSMMGVEGGHMIDGSPAVLRLYYQLGVRYLTLTHGCHTSWADSCGPKEPLHDGINEFGRQMIAEMNRMGMLVDLSHVSHETMRQVLNHTRAPVIFSHSSAFALCPDPRNVPDDVLARLRETDGVVMVNFYSGFITCDPAERGMVADVADHIEHIVRIAGGEHVGLGADFDGVDRLPVGLDDVASYPNLIAELIRRRMDEKTIAGLLGKNLLRVWRRVEQYRDSQVNGGLVLEDFQHLEKQCAVAGEFLTIQSYAAAD